MLVSVTETIPESGVGDIVESTGMIKTVITVQVASMAIRPRVSEVLKPLPTLEG